MSIVKRELNIGLPKPLRVLHISDIHLTYADSRDCEKKRNIAKGRTEAFGKYGDIPALFDKYMSYGRENCDLIVCTGDIMDFVSAANLDELRRVCAEDNFIFAVGNHEFAQYIGDPKEDFYYKMQSYTDVQSCVPTNIDFASTVVGGINFVTLDNVYYDFTEKQLELLKAECKKEYPIILCMHTPIYEEKLFDKVTGGGKWVSFLCGCPTERINYYPKDRFEQQKADDMTMKVAEFITTQPQIKAILSGHCHRFEECTFPSGLVQYVADGTYHDSAIELLIK